MEGRTKIAKQGTSGWAAPPKTIVLIILPRPLASSRAFATAFADLVGSGACAAPEPSTKKGIAKAQSKKGQPAEHAEHIQGLRRGPCPGDSGPE